MFSSENTADIGGDYPQILTHKKYRKKIHRKESAI